MDPFTTMMWDVELNFTVDHSFLQLGKLLGCVVGLKNSITGVTIIAIGTSLPDTFASRSAALHDIGADASIGNITGWWLYSAALKQCGVLHFTIKTNLLTSFGNSGI